MLKKLRKMLVGLCDETAKDVDLMIETDKMAKKELEKLIKELKEQL